MIQKQFLRGDKKSSRPKSKRSGGQGGMGGGVKGSSKRAFALLCIKSGKLEVLL